ncbi:MAG: hypothetical protein EP311_06625 [Cytophagales bacterium]|nr:MAG: hypothetical protein EP311_06625 [Cytophagales bacterium]
MKKIGVFLVWMGFLLAACQEEEKPNSPYGVYVVESITSSVPVDFTNSGEQTTDHLENFSWCSSSDYSISWFLNRQTPVIDIYTFGFFERVDEISKEKKIVLGCGLSRRIVYLIENGNLDLTFWGDEGGLSNDSNQFLSWFEILSLEYFQVEKKIKMVTNQVVYDFTLE